MVNNMAKAKNTRENTFFIPVISFDHISVPPYQVKQETDPGRPFDIPFS